MFNSISKLESETKGFDESKFEEKIEELRKKRNDKTNNDENWGIVDNQVKTAEKTITEIKESIRELEKVKDYISKLNNIQKNVFSIERLELRILCSSDLLRYKIISTEVKGKTNNTNG